MLCPIDCSTARPIAVRGTTKYGDTGLFSEDSFNGHTLTTGTKTLLARAANNSLDQATWSVYRTASNHLQNCQLMTRVDMSLPVNQEKVLVFIGWLLQERKVKAATAESYLSEICHLHICDGFDIPCIRPDIVKSVLSGTRNMEIAIKLISPTPSRLSVTASVMQLLKLELVELPNVKQDIRLFWAVACIAFMGAFCIHELLARAESFYDPAFTLLQQDISLNQVSNDTKILQIKLKSPKEDRVGNFYIVDVYESKGDLCPIKAMKSGGRELIVERTFQHFARKMEHP